MRNDFTLRLEPSKIAGLTLDASSALNLNPKYTKAQQFKATVDTTDGWMQRRAHPLLLIRGKCFKFLL